MKTITHLTAIRLFKELVDRIPVQQSGTYNQRQDATAFQKGQINVLGYTVQWDDCTWGEKLKIRRPGFKTEMYYDFQYKQIFDHGIAKGTWKVISGLLKEIKENNLYPSKLEQHNEEIKRWKQSSEEESLYMPSWMF
jgi:hypothetical protein